MRFTKAENLLRLAIWMKSSYSGIGLQEIQDEFDVGRRTAERMRDAVSRLLPDLEEVKNYGSRKRWKIPKGRSLLPIKISAEELASVQIAGEILENENLTEHAKRLQGLKRKIQALEGGQGIAGREVDLAAIIEAEGLAMRLGPRPKVDTETLETLRLAILKCEQVTLHYLGQGSGQISRQQVCPYGFLYGKQHYLVAYNTNSQIKDYRLFRLDNIQKVVAMKQAYERRDDFSLQQYAEQSFGIFQGEIHDVELLFSPKVANDAKSFQFHPNQKLIDLEAGELKLEMSASGLRELAWHLITWGGEVTVTKPKQLKEMVGVVQQAITGSKSWQGKDYNN